jgi:ligand-binding sensor domain-containing protein
LIVSIVARSFVYRLPIFAAGILLALALAPGASAQRYHVHHYSQRDGLPSSVVYDVVQDRSGRMWFATRAGVAVYDGHGWHGYDEADGLFPSSQARLVEDETGTLWSAGLGDRVLLFRFDGRRWHPLAPEDGAGPVQDRVLSLATRARAGGVEVAVGTEKAGLWVWDGARWHAFGPSEGVEGPVFAIAAAHDRFWLATRQGLRSLRGDRLEAVALPTPEPTVLGLDL